MFLGSDALALAPFTDTITYLEDGDWVVLTHAGAEFHDSSNLSVQRARQRSQASAFLIDKGNHRHFMAKEIHEQPEVVGRTLSHYVDLAQGRVAQRHVTAPQRRASPEKGTVCRTRGSPSRNRHPMLRPGGE